MANRKLNVMAKLKMAAEAFTTGSNFQKYSLEIVKPQPTVKAKLLYLTWLIPD